MKKKLNLFKNNYLDKLPEDHPIFRIHASVERRTKEGGSITLVERSLIFLRFLVSCLCVFVVLIPSDILRWLWSLLLNIFSNHGSTYWYFLKRFYLLIVQELVSLLVYFIVLMPYGILAKIYRWPLRTDSSNTDEASARYQS